MIIKMIIEKPGQKN